LTLKNDAQRVAKQLHEKTKGHKSQAYNSTVRYKIGCYDITNNDYSDLILNNWTTNTTIQGYLSCILGSLKCLIVDSQSWQSILNDPLQHNIALRFFSQIDVHKYNFLVGVELVDNNHLVGVVVEPNRGVISIIDPYGVGKRSDIQSDLFSSCSNYFNVFSE
jgi:hypothetical protein